MTRVRSEAVFDKCRMNGRLRSLTGDIGDSKGNAVIVEVIDVDDVSAD